MIFVIGFFTIGALLSVKILISYLTECMNDEVLKQFVLPNELLEITSFPSFHFINKFKKLLHFNKEI